MLRIKKTLNIFNMVTFGVDTQFGGNMFQSDFNSLHIIICFQEECTNLELYINSEINISKNQNAF